MFKGSLTQLNPSERWVCVGMLTLILDSCINSMLSDPYSWSKPLSLLGSLCGWAREALSVATGVAINLIIGIELDAEHSIFHIQRANPHDCVTFTRIAVAAITLYLLRHTINQGVIFLTTPALITCVEVIMSYIAELMDILSSTLEPARPPAVWSPSPLILRLSAPSSESSNTRFIPLPSMVTPPNVQWPVDISQPKSSKTSETTRKATFGRSAQESKKTKSPGLTSSSTATSKSSSLSSSSSKRPKPRKLTADERLGLAALYGHQVAWDEIPDRWYANARWALECHAPTASQHESIEPGSTIIQSDTSRTEISQKSSKDLVEESVQNGGVSTFSRPEVESIRNAALSPHESPPVALSQVEPIVFPNAPPAFSELDSTLYTPNVPEVTPVDRFAHLLPSLAPAATGPEPALTLPTPSSSSKGKEKAKEWSEFLQMQPGVSTTTITSNNQTTTITPNYRAAAPLGQTEKPVPIPAWLLAWAPPTSNLSAGLSPVAPTTNVVPDACVQGLGECLMVDAFEPVPAFEVQKVASDVTPAPLVGPMEAAVPIAKKTELVLSDGTPHMVTEATGTPIMMEPPVVQVEMGLPDANMGTPEQAGPATPSTVDASNAIVSIVREDAINDARDPSLPPSLETTPALPVLQLEEEEEEEEEEKESEMGWPDESALNLLAELCAMNATDVLSRDTHEMRTPVGTANAAGASRNEIIPAASIVPLPIAQDEVSMEPPKEPKPPTPDMMEVAIVAPVPPPLTLDNSMQEMPKLSISQTFPSNPPPPALAPSGFISPTSAPAAPMEISSNDASILSFQEINEIINMTPIDTDDEIPGLSQADLDAIMSYIPADQGKDANSMQCSVEVNTPPVQPNAGDGRLDMQFMQSWGTPMDRNKKTHVPPGCVIPTGLEKPTTIESTQAAVTLKPVVKAKPAVTVAIRYISDEPMLPPAATPRDIKSMPATRKTRGLVSTAPAAVPMPTMLAQPMLPPAATPRDMRPMPTPRKMKGSVEAASVAAPIPTAHTQPTPRPEMGAWGSPAAVAAAEKNKQHYFPPLPNLSTSTAGQPRSARAAFVDSFGLLEPLKNAPTVFDTTVTRIVFGPPNIVTVPSTTPMVARQPPQAKPTPTSNLFNPKASAQNRLNAQRYTANMAQASTSGLSKA